MYVEPKITDLKHSQVQHGLERLAQFGIRSSLWNRLRFDDTFAKSVAEKMTEMNSSSPGERYVGNLEKHFTRLELSELLQKQGVRSLRDDIIQNLLPDDKKTDQPELIGTPHSFEWFVVSPGYRMDEEGVRMEIDRRGLVPANTEDGMAFMLHHRKTTLEKGVVVLDSWRIQDDEKEFLILAHTMSGIPTLFLTSGENLQEREKYLAKKRTAQEPTVSED